MCPLCMLQPIGIETWCWHMGTFVYYHQLFLLYFVFVIKGLGMIPAIVNLSQSLGKMNVLLSAARFADIG